MSESKQTVRINAVVEVTTESLQTIVETAKKIVGRNEKGVYRVDTADAVGAMISRFLMENDFELFVKDVNNYNLRSRNLL